ncbi:unnamed protein product [Cochlearia groenlandica]
MSREETRGFHLFQTIKVLNLEADVGQWEWKPIDCNFPHTPKTKSLCFDEEVFYGAYVSRTEIVMIHVLEDMVNNKWFSFTIETPSSLQEITNAPSFNGFGQREITVAPKFHGFS